MSAISYLLLLLTASFLLTFLLRRLALRRRWLDIPNDRSSHRRPTPKSGGLGFVAVFAAAAVLAWRTGTLSGLQLAALGMVLPMALLGLLDDLYNLTIATRISVQSVLALAVMACLGGLPSLPLPGGLLEPGWFGWLAGALGLLWLTNLYNFMDGIDALAAAEALFVALAGAFFAARAGFPPDALLFLGLAAAVAGFLTLNLPPARIFMGDAGSNALGLILGTLGLIAAHRGYLHLWAWAILLGVFIVDSSLTLALRFARGRLWYHAHRSHAYQHAAIRLRSHGKVDLFISLINFVWLFPLAWISLAYVEWAMLIIIIAYTPLIYLGIYYKAGSARGPGEAGPGEYKACDLPDRNAGDSR